MILAIPAVYDAIVRADFENYRAIGDRLLIDQFGLANDYGIDPTMRMDVLYTVAARCPSLIGDVAILLARGQHDEASALVLKVLEVVQSLDPQLFVGAPSKEMFVRRLRRMMPPTSARAHAERTGVVEARREAYTLSHKFADESYSERFVPEVERRPGMIGLDLRETRWTLAARLANDDQSQE